MKSVSASAGSARFDWLVDWLFPPRCRACGAWLAGRRDSDYFCASCGPDIRLVSHPLCSLCGQPFIGAAGDDHPCAACILRPPYFDRARAWARYPREELDEHPLRQVVQKFKYGRKVSLGKPLGRLMARGCQEFLQNCPADLIVPVPLHPRRLRWRGFNQAVLLARQVSRVCRTPMDPFVLVRRRETPPQTQLTEQERRKNVRGAFALNPARPIEAKRVLLIDDVYTSGATVNECSRELRRGGAAKIYVLTLARAA
jgi:ComF family protein